jgi:hypothetical protein
MVQVAKHARACVFAVVSSLSEREALAGTRFSPDHIVDNADELGTAEVVINPIPSSGPYDFVAQILAPLGRFVQVGALDFDMGPRLNVGCSFAGAILSAVADALPTQIAVILDSVAGFFTPDLISDPFPIHPVRLDQLPEVLPTMTHCERIRKVLVPVKGEVIKVGHPFLRPTKHQTNLCPDDASETDIAQTRPRGCLSACWWRRRPW